MATMSPKFGHKHSTAKCHRVVIRRPHEAVGEQSIIDSNWEKEGWLACPEFCRLGQEHFELARAITDRDGQVRYLSSDWIVSMNSMMVRDSAIVCPDGSVIQTQIKTVNRLGETEEVCAYLEQLGLNVIGSVDPEHVARGSDFVLINHNIYICAETSETSIPAREQIQKLLLSKNPDLKFINCDGLNTRHQQLTKGKEGENKLPGHLSDRLCCAISPVKDNVVVACSALLGEDTVKQLKDLGIQIVDVSPEAWSLGAADILSLTPQLVCLRRTSEKPEDNDPLLKDVADKLTTEHKLVVTTFRLRDLPLSGAVLNAFVLPYSRC